MTKKFVRVFNVPLFALLSIFWITIDIIIHPLLLEIKKEIGAIILVPFIILNICYFTGLFLLCNKKYAYRD